MAARATGTPEADERLSPVQRVAVIGCGGAGKSTLARALGQRLGLPVVHLDEHYWSPGWRPTEPAAWRARQEGLVAAEGWVIDGNYLTTLDVRLSAADTVVFLDLAPWRCALQATRRVVAGRGRANTAPGCPERLDRRHLSFLRYIVSDFRHRLRPRLLRALAEQAPTAAIIRLTSPGQVRRFAAGACGHPLPPVLGGFGEWRAPVPLSPGSGQPSARRPPAGRGASRR